MSLSRAYQEVIAGRVREDEQISFFGDNKVAVPGRITSSNAIGGKKLPIGDKDFLGTEFVGKKDNRDVANLNFWLPSSYNVSV